MRSWLSIVVAFTFFYSTIPLPAQEQPKTSTIYVAVLDFKVGEGLSKDLGATLGDRVRETLAKIGKYSIIDRATTRERMEEIKRSQSGNCEESCEIQVGKELSATFIVTGRVTKLAPDKCRVFVQMTDVEKAELLPPKSELCSCESMALENTAEILAYDLTGVPRPAGKMIIKSTPSGSAIFIDGEKKGYTPYEIELPAGSYKVMIRHKKYKSEEQTVYVSPGASVKLNFPLKKDKKKWYKAWWFYTVVGVVVIGGVVAAVSGGGGGGGNNTATPGTGSIGASW